ncbi:coniferyl aldehyde dehydrogenase [Roseobacter sp. HKCCA2468]|uniref:coniferyl aldehyde dehydrogenase n=1 Tax=Roseobacter sp. HKCCA2468 TaxID=3120342 RepID=UPI0030EE4F53
MTDLQAITQATPLVRTLFDTQRAGFDADPYPSLQERLDRLDRLNAALAAHKEELIAAINRDFGCRSRSETLIAEILGCHGAIHYARKNLRKWMKLRRRHTSFWSLPAKCYVVPQPLGVVGIMAPWNYPLHLAVAPLVAALAAGNRAMIWMSDEVPHTARCLSDLMARTFDNALVTVMTGDARQAAEFAALPFDHLLFTGSTRVGKLIAAAAAPNLTPVTLELGGKSPAIVAPDYAIKEAAARITWGKSFNAGQTCIAPDYVLVPRGDARRFADQVLANFKQHFNSILDHDYTAIVSERFFRRLNTLLDEARDKGATILQPYGIEQSVVDGTHKVPLTIVLDAPADCALMQEEIFGPILPVIGYDTLDEAIAYVAARDKPLSLYCFSHDRSVQRDILRRTSSGSVGINDALLQYIQEDLAFGGVGASGMGSYHGKEGFDTFSHAKSVFEQRGFGHFTGVKLLYPPYGPISRAVLRLMGV